MMGNFSRLFSRRFSLIVAISEISIWPFFKTILKIQSQETFSFLFLLSLIASKWIKTNALPEKPKLSKITEIWRETEKESERDRERGEGGQGGFVRL